MILHFHLASTKLSKGPPVLVLQKFYDKKFENFRVTFSATVFSEICCRNLYCSKIKKRDDVFEFTNTSNWYFLQILCTLTFQCHINLTMIHVKLHVLQMSKYAGNRMPTF